MNNYKFYFLDACRGDDLPQLIPGAKVAHPGQGNMDYINVEMNKSIMYSNSKGYCSFEVPFDEIKNDIKQLSKKEFDKLDLVNYRPKCGIFANAVYHTFSDNVYKYNYERAYLIIQDDIRDKMDECVIPIIANWNKKINQLPDDGGNCNLRNRDKQRIVFAHNRSFKGKLSLIDQKAK